MQCNHCGWKKGHRQGCPKRKPPSPSGPVEPPGAYVEPPQDGQRQLLKDMWHVWHNDASHDKTRSHRQCRAQLDQDNVKFFAQISRLERELAASGGGSGGAVKKDEGTERCEVVILRLLEEFKAERAAAKAAESKQ